MALILPKSFRCGLIPHAWSGSLERPITGIDWSIASQSGAASLSLSPNVPHAACLRGAGPGNARVTARIFADGKEFVIGMDIQVVEVVG